MVKCLTVLLIGKHSLLMTSVAARLQQRRRSCLVSIATTAEEAAGLAEDRQVDLVIIDLDTAELACPEICRTLRAGRPNVHIVLISAALDDCRVEQALAVGARALLLKADVPSGLPAAIDEVLAGGSSFPEEIRSRIVIDSTGVRLGAYAKPTSGGSLHGA